MKISFELFSFVLTFETFRVIERKVIPVLEITYYPSIKDELVNYKANSIVFKSFRLGIAIEWYRDKETLFVRG